MADKESPLNPKLLEAKVVEEALPMLGEVKSSCLSLCSFLNKDAKVVGTGLENSKMKIVVESGKGILPSNMIYVAENMSVDYSNGLMFDIDVNNRIIKLVENKYTPEIDNKVESFIDYMLKKGYEGWKKTNSNPVK